MKNTLLLLTATVVLITSCTDNDNYRPVNRYYDCSLLDYLKQNSQYDSLVLMIQKAGLENLYSGKMQDYPELTFFAFTNASLVIYMQQTFSPDGERLYWQINDIPDKTCRDLLLSHTITKKYKRDDFGFEIKGTLSGGTLLPNLLDDTVRIYRIKTDFYGTADIGIPRLAIHFKANGAIENLATYNQEMQNAVLHTLATTSLITEQTKE